MLEGVLEEFLEKVNQTLEPIKDQTLNLDRLSLLFLLIGFIGITILAFIIGYALNFVLGVLLVVLYVISLAYTFHRNNKELKVLQQAHLLNMAIIVYLENQNIF